MNVYMFVFVRCLLFNVRCRLAFRLRFKRDSFAIITPVKLKSTLFFKFLKTFLFYQKLRFLRQP